MTVIKQTNLDLSFESKHKLFAFAFFAWGGLCFAAYSCPFLLSIRAHGASREHINRQIKKSRALTGAICFAVSKMVSSRQT